MSVALGMAGMPSCTSGQGLFRKPRRSTETAISVHCVGRMCRVSRSFDGANLVPSCVITGRRDTDTQKRRGTAEARRLGSRRVLQVQGHHSQPGIPIRILSSDFSSCAGDIGQLAECFLVRIAIRDITSTFVFVFHIQLVNEYICELESRELRVLPYSKSTCKRPRGDIGVSGVHGCDQAEKGPVPRNSACLEQLLHAGQGQGSLTTVPYALDDVHVASIHNDRASAACFLPPRVRGCRLFYEHRCYFQPQPGKFMATDCWTLAAPLVSLSLPTKFRSSRSRSRSLRQHSGNQELATCRLTCHEFIHCCIAPVTGALGRCVRDRPVLLWYP